MDDLTRARQARYRETHQELRLVYWARRRAAKKGLECTITPEDIHIPTHCPVLGIPLERNVGGKAGGPNSPSIDRIDNSRGYTPDNIMVISGRANALKGDATPAELRILADFYSNEENLRGNL